MSRISGEDGASDKVVSEAPPLNSKVKVPLIVPPLHLSHFITISDG